MAGINQIIIRAGVGPASTIPLLVLHGLSPLYVADPQTIFRLYSTDESYTLRNTEEDYGLTNTEERYRIKRTN